MDGIIVVNKQKYLTSRDVVNEVCKILNTKKIGHTGTLDPIATGVLVLCIGKATKLVDMITSNNKEYIATVKLGLKTDTLDISGNILEKRECNLTKEELKNVLDGFVGKYNQEVPIYSAVKVGGKKLYEYARSGSSVKLPKREVEIKEIELIRCSTNEYSFRVVVSKGTYIRSLINDINNKLGIIGVMSDLIRTRQGIFDIDDSYTIENIKEGNFKLIPISSALSNYYHINLDETLYKTVINGGIIKNIYNKDIVVFTYNNNVIAIYKNYGKKAGYMKPDKMFINNKN